jgi:replication factor C small subunit
MSKEKSLWVDKFRPKTLDGYVWSDSSQKKQVLNWIKEKHIPNLLISGGPGTGKSTLSKCLLNELSVHSSDIRFVNGSHTTGVEDIRNLSRFAETMPSGDFRYVVIDECDFLSINAQAALRNMIEEYTAICRWILTCVTGDTLIYTPYGYKKIENVQTYDKILNDRGVDSTNHHLVSKITNGIFEIKTKHGYSIKTTGNHVLKSLVGDVSVETLSLNDRILIDIKNTVGKHFEYTNSDGFFNKLDFKNWLQAKNILSNTQLEFLRSNNNLWFNKTYHKIYSYILNHNMRSFVPLELSRQTNISINSIRNFIDTINNYVLDKKYVGKNKFNVSIDLDSLINDVTNYHSYIKLLGINYKQNHKNWFLNDQYSQEFICNMLPNEFSDDYVLSIGRLVGFFEGDGHISTMIHCAADNSETLDKVDRDINKFVTLSSTTKPNGKNSKGLCRVYQSQILKLILEYFGATIGNKTKIVRHIPKWCTNKLFFRGYMQGFYDSDGKSLNIIKDNVTVNPLCLTQNIYSDSQIVLFDEIKQYLKLHFDINVITSIVNQSKSTFSGSDKCMLLLGLKQDDILKYLESINYYYDKIIKPEIIGYLRYKKYSNHRHILNFTQWLSAYYGFGFINDEIVEINYLPESHTVYDCSFTDYHWYITNGFISHNCNYEHKIIPALKSRTQGFKIDALDKEEFLTRIANILIAENIELTEENLEILDEYATVTYPDLRKCINLLQQNCFDNTLNRPSTGSSNSSSEYMVTVVNLFKNDRILEARKLICANIRPEEYEDMYKLLYRNLEWWGSDEASQNQAIVIIANRLRDHALIADAEICLSACLTELSMI